MMNTAEKKISLGKFKLFFSDIVGFFQHYFASKRNHYQFKILGEKQNTKEPYNTIILYRVLGKRDTIFEIPIKELMNEKELIEGFHPTEAIKIGAIAMGDSLFQEDEHLRKQRFDEIKKKMLDHVRR